MPATRPLEVRYLVVGDSVSFQYDTRGGIHRQRVHDGGDNTNDFFHIRITDITTARHLGASVIVLRGYEIIPHVTISEPIDEYDLTDNEMRFYAPYINHLQFYNSGLMDSLIVPRIESVSVQSNQFYLLTYLLTDGNEAQRIVKIESQNDTSVRIYNYRSARHTNILRSNILRAVEVVPFRNEYGAVMNYDYLDVVEDRIHISGGFYWAEIDAPRITDSIPHWQGPRIPGEWSEVEVVL